MRSKTIGSATGGNNVTGVAADYTTFNSWISSIPSTPNDDETGTSIYIQAATDTTKVDLNKDTTSYQLLLTAHALAYVNAPTYAAATSRARISVSSGTAVDFNGRNWTVEKIGIVGGSIYNAFASNNGVTVRNIVIVSGGSDTVNCQVTCDLGCIMTQINIAAITTAGATGIAAIRGSSAVAYQCSAVGGSGRGFLAGSDDSSYPVSGCIATGFGGSDFLQNGVMTGNYNVSSDTSAHGANSLISQAGVFANTSAGTEDLTLTSAVTYAIVNRSGFPSDTDTDIAGTTRPVGQADAGCWENPGIVPMAGSNSGYQAAQSSYSWSHTNYGDYLTVGVGMLSLAQTVTGITYNSVAMTFLGSKNSVSGACRVELWGLIAPATGSHTVAVTLSGSIASAAVAGSFFHVHQTTPTEAFNSAQATNVGAADATVNVTTVADNDFVVDIVATDDTAISAGAGQTELGNVSGAGGTAASSYEGPKTPAGSVTMSWSNVGALATWSIAAIGLRPNTASGGSSSPSSSISSSPSSSVSSSPSSSVSSSPSSSPSPSSSISSSPSSSISSSPSSSISSSPSSSVSSSPSSSPSPSSSISSSPSSSISSSPSSSPSPSSSISSSPSSSVSSSPSSSISSSPSSSISSSPSSSPSSSISSSPSSSISSSPSSSISSSPSSSVSSSPSSSPSHSISSSPSSSPSPSSSISSSPSVGSIVLYRWTGSAWVKAKLKVFE